MMLDQAAKGGFSEKTFDEPRLSALESRFAHQTKTPIANLILYSELLMENCRDEGQRRDIDALYQQAQKLNFLIVSLVKLSRLETGIVEVNPGKNSIIRLAESVSCQYQPLAEQKGLY